MDRIDSGADAFRLEIIFRDALLEIAEDNNLCLAFRCGENSTDYAKRLIEALTEKIIAIDTDIERIEGLVPDAVKDL